MNFSSPIWRQELQHLRVTLQHPTTGLEISKFENFNFHFSDKNFEKIRKRLIVVSGKLLRFGQSILGGKFCNH